MDKKIYKINGMHCASCVALIQKKVSRIPGVESCSVGLASEKATVIFSNKIVSTEELNKPIKPLGYSFEELEKEIMKHSDKSHNDEHNHGDVQHTAFEMRFVIPMIVFSFLMMGWEVLAQNNIIGEMSETLYEVSHHLMPIFATFVLFGI